MIYARSPALDDLGARRARRGALPPGRLPRPGVGGGDHPPPCARPARVPVGDGEQRRRAGRLDRDGARADDRRSSRRGARSRLDDHYLVGDRTNDRLHFLPTFVDGCPNPDASRRSTPRRCAEGATADARRGAAASGCSTRRAGSRRSSCSRSARPAAGDLLHLQPQPVRRGGAPASPRPACGSPTRRERERDPRRSSTSGSAGSTTPTSPCSATTSSLAQLEAGVAPHHAGMVPPFKEAVEQCFTAGLVKVVFATETLAVGINMPARTVVIEKLTKFTGDHHELLTPGRVHPAHRAGRAAGHRRRRPGGRAVVPVRAVRPGRRAGRQPLVPPALGVPPDLQHGGQPRARVHAASRPTTCSTCRSPSTRPTATSCASRPAPSGSGASVVERRGPRPRAATATSGSTAPSGRPSARLDGRSERESALARLRPGDVVRVSRGRYRGPAVMVASASRKAGMRLTVISEDAESLLVTADDVIGPVEALGKVRLPGTFQPKDRQYRREVAKRARPSTLAAPAARRHRAPARPRAPRRPSGRARSRPARSGCAPRRRPSACERELADVDDRVDGHNRSLGREFDRVLGVLEHRGYLDGRRAAGR